MAKILTSKPLGFFTPDPGNPRQHVPNEELRELHDSLKKQQFVPLLAKQDGLIIDGWRRWSAAMLDGKPDHLDVIITEEKLSLAEIRGIQLVTALHKMDFTPWEQFLGCRDWLTLNTGATAKDLAATIDRDPSMLMRILSLAKCIPSVQQAAAEGRLGVSDWYAISKVAEPDQEKMLAAKLAGASRDQLEQRGRKLRRGANQAIRINRLKVPIGSQGRSVTLAGTNLSLDDAIELLQETLKFARKAQCDSLDGKTWVQVMKQKAMTGA